MSNGAFLFNGLRDSHCSTFVPRTVRGSGRVALLLFPLLLTAAARTQVSAADELVVWITRQRSALAENLAAAPARQARAQEVVLKAEAALQRATSSEAKRMADEAVEAARRNLAKITTKRRIDAEQLAVLEKMSSLRSRPQLQVVGPGDREISPANPRTSTAAQPEHLLRHFGAATVYGVVEIETATGWTPFDPEKPMLPGDEVRTGPNGLAKVIFSDGSYVQLGPDSAFTLEQLDGDTSVIGGITGRFHATVERLIGSGQHKIDTKGPSMGGVRGTDFAIEAPEGQATTWFVFSGTVDVTIKASGQTMAVKEGEKITVSPEGVLGPVLRIDSSTVNRWWESPPPPRPTG